MPLRLRVIPPASASAGPAAERAVDFDDGIGQIRIGRRADLELSLPFSPLSGVHARLVRASNSDTKADHWLLEDLGSTNGTYVGGERLKPGIKHPLIAGTQIKLAEIKLIFDGDVRAKGEGEGQGGRANRVTGTGKVVAEASNKVTGKTQSEPSHRSTGKVVAEASNRATGKTQSEVSSKAEGKTPSKSDSKPRGNEPTQTYVRPQFTDVVSAAPSAPEVPYLTVVNGDAATKFRLEQRDHAYLFGRTRRCEFRVDVNEVSREHASFTRRNDGTYVNDLDSVNGVLVNNTRVKEYRLYDGDLIQIGRVKLRLFDPAESPPPAERSASRGAHSLSALLHGAPAQSGLPHSAPAHRAMHDAPAAPAYQPSGAHAHAHVEASSTFHPAIAGALAAEGGGDDVGYRRRPSVRIRLQETWEASNKFRYVIVIVAASLLAFCAVMIGFRLAS